MSFPRLVHHSSHFVLYSLILERHLLLLLLPLLLAVTVLIFCKQLNTHYYMIFCYLFGLRLNEHVKYHQSKACHNLLTPGRAHRWTACIQLIDLKDSRQLAGATELAVFVTEGLTQHQYSLIYELWTSV